MNHQWYTSNMSIFLMPHKSCWETMKVSKEWLPWANWKQIAIANHNIGILFDHPQAMILKFAKIFKFRLQIVNQKQLKIYGTLLLSVSIWHVTHWQSWLRLKRCKIAQVPPTQPANFNVLTGWVSTTKRDTFEIIGKRRDNSRIGITANSENYGVCRLRNGENLNMWVLLTSKDTCFLSTFFALKFFFTVESQNAAEILTCKEWTGLLYLQREKEKNSKRRKQFWACCS